MQRSNNGKGMNNGYGVPGKADYKKHNKERFLYTTNELW